MLRLRSLAVLVAALLVTTASAQVIPKGMQKNPPKSTPTAPATAAATLATAHGVVDKAAKDSLTVKPRGADGRFEKELAIQVTGTSKVSVVSMQMRAGKMVPVQQDANVTDLKPQQAVAVVYTQTDAGPVLLTAVALPAS
jgi:hypothetical protein